MKRIVVVAAFLVLGIGAGVGGTFVAFGNRPSEGEVAQLEAAARDRGHADGYEAGEAAGLREGEATGFERGEAAGFQQGKDAGFQQGFDKGYDSGYEDGYQAGFDDWYGWSQKDYDKAWQAGYEAGCLEGGGNINIFGECLEPFTLPPIP